MMTASPPSGDTRKDASMATDRESWLARLDEICREEGYFEPLGDKHWAFFADEGTTLLVTFETMEAIRAGSPTQMPMGCSQFGETGWSHLAIIADGETWFRDPGVYRYFDRLVDDAFFEDFDRVVFYGAGMGAYAACAFSVCAPGATVLAIQPRATLDPEVAGWDRRHLDKRRLDFTHRYGFAPDMTEGAGEVFVVFDPHQTEDAMHAALFTKPFVRKLRMPHLGGNLEKALQNMQILPLLIVAACEGRLTPALFAQLARRRRNYTPYLRGLINLTEASGQMGRALAVCRSVVSRLNAPRFKRRLSDLEARCAGGAPAAISATDEEDDTEA